jgi:glycosyltransferase involved in cell wall biosynthesis
VNVLYVDHTSLVSGAQRALLDLVDGLPSTVAPTVMCPAGPLAEMVRTLGVRVVEFSGTSGSLRLHPWHTLRAAGEIAVSGRALYAAAAATNADVVHANSIRAGLIAGGVRALGGPPTVTHIHDALPHTRSADLVRRAIAGSADAVITISNYTTENFMGSRSRQRIHMLHNPLDVSRFDPDAITKEEARSRLGIPHDAKLVGLVAQITPWKGQDTAIRAMQLLRQRHPEARLVLVGSTKFVEKATRYDNLSFEQWLRKLVHVLDLDEHVEFLGEREDVPAVVRALDVVVAPSWEEPFGRSVIEAMALETAVVATSVGGPAEYIEHGVDGVVLPPRAVEQWAVALDRLLQDVSLREEMARRASRKVRQLFDRRDYVSSVLQVYDQIAHRPVRGGFGGHAVDGGGDLREPVVP